MKFLIFTNKQPDGLKHFAGLLETSNLIDAKIISKKLGYSSVVYQCNYRIIRRLQTHNKWRPLIIKPLPENFTIETAKKL
jgi:hypothetical protein